MNKAPLMTRVKTSEMIWMEVQTLQIWLITNKMMMISKILQTLDKVKIIKKRIFKTKLFNHLSAEKNG